MAIEIVDFPINSMVDFPWQNHQRVDVSHPEKSTEYPFGISMTWMALIGIFCTLNLIPVPVTGCRCRPKSGALLWGKMVTLPFFRSLFFAFRSGSEIEDFLEDLMVELVEPQPFAGISMDLSYSLNFSSQVLEIFFSIP